MEISRMQQNWRRQQPNHSYKHYKSLKKMYYSFVRPSKFCRKVNNYATRNKIPINDLWIMAIHLCATKDDLKLLEWIYHRRYISHDIIAHMVNTTLGPNQYTPLFRAAYAGSLNMIKALISYGSDVTKINTHGENVLSCLQAGVYNSIHKMPHNKIFIVPRYNDCKKYLLSQNEWKIKKKKVYVKN